MANLNAKSGWFCTKDDVPHIANDGTIVKLNSNQVMIIPSQKKYHSVGKIVIYNKHFDRPWKIINVQFPNNYPQYSRFPACMDETKRNVLIYSYSDIIYALNLDKFEITEKQLNIAKDKNITDYPKLNWSQLINVNNKLFLITNVGIEDGISTLFKLNECNDKTGYDVEIIKTDKLFMQYRQAIFASNYQKIYFFGRDTMIFDIATKEMRILNNLYCFGYAFYDTESVILSHDGKYFLRLKGAMLRNSWFSKYLNKYEEEERKQPGIDNLVIDDKGWDLKCNKSSIKAPIPEQNGDIVGLWDNDTSDALCEGYVKCEFKKDEYKGMNLPPRYLIKIIQKYYMINDMLWISRHYFSHTKRKCRCIKY